MDYFTHIFCSLYREYSFIKSSGKYEKEQQVCRPTQASLWLFWEIKTGCTMHFRSKRSALDPVVNTEEICSFLQWSFGQSLHCVLFCFIHWFTIIFISTETSMLLPCFPVFLFMLTLTPDLLHTLGNHIIFILMHLSVSFSILPFFFIWVSCNVVHTLCMHWK